MSRTARRSRRGLLIPRAAQPRLSYYLNEPLEPRLLLAITVNHPESIVLGDWASISIPITNAYGVTADAAIFASFPSFGAAGDGARINDNGSSSDCAYTEFPAGSTINTQSGQSMTAQYMLTRWRDTNFTAGESNTIRATVCPKSSGTFMFYVRGVAQAGATSVLDPASGSLTDQQGFFVYAHSISVVNNSPPDAPANPSPAASAANVLVRNDLAWTGTDPNGETVYYTVYLDRDNPNPSTAILTDSTATTVDPGILQPSAHYYWRVRADDHRGGTTTLGPVWEFWTEPLPAPEILSITHLPTVVVGQWAEVVVRVRNNGGTGDAGGLSVSFPSFASPADGINVDDAASDGDCIYGEYPAGSTIGNHNGFPLTMTALHMLVEWNDASFDNGEVNTFIFRVRPLEIGDFVVRLRSTVGMNGNYETDPYKPAFPPDKLPEDQQGWPCMVETIRALPDAGETMAGSLNLGSLTAGANTWIDGNIGDSLHASRDTDVYRFTTDAAGLVTLRATVTEPEVEVAGYLRLFDEAGTPLTWAEGGAGQPASLTRRLPPGTYYAGISGYPNRYYDITRAGTSVASPAHPLAPYRLTALLTDAITLKATYDGDPDPETFGPFLVGAGVPPVVNVFTAYVGAAPGHETSEVWFDTNFNAVRDGGDTLGERVGTTSQWQCPLNVSALPGDRDLWVWVIDANGEFSPAPASFRVRTRSLPSWMDLSLTSITFRSTGEYLIDTVACLQKMTSQTPGFLPGWLSERDGSPTYNGAYIGLGIHAELNIKGSQTLIATDAPTPVAGYMMFGSGQAFRFAGGPNMGGSYGMADFVRRFSDTQDYFDPGQFEWAHPFGDSLGAQLGLQFSGSAELGTDLEFRQLQAHLDLGLAEGSCKFAVELPAVWYPVVLGIDIVFTPHIAFWPIFNVSSTWDLDIMGQPRYDPLVLDMGLGGEFGVTGEVSVLGGALTGGLDITAGIEMHFIDEYPHQATPAEPAHWHQSIELSLLIDFDFVGSVAWGLWSGRAHLYNARWDGIVLWSSDSPPEAAGGSLLPDTLPTRNLVPINSAIARDANGDLAIAYIPVSLDGTASPLLVSRCVGGVWLPPETIVSASFHRGNPAIVSMGGGKWLVMWSQSTLPADSLAGRTPDEVMAQQDIYYAYDTNGAVGPVSRLTTNAWCDDSPVLTRLPNGNVYAVWRAMSDASHQTISASDLKFAIWDNIRWRTFDLSGPGKDEQLSEPAAAALSNDRMVAVWIADATGQGTQRTVHASITSGSISGTSVRIDSGSPGIREWTQLAVLSDGRALALWKEADRSGATLMLAERDPATGVWSSPAPLMTRRAIVSRPILLADGMRIQVLFHGYGVTDQIMGLGRDYADPSSAWTEPQPLTPADGIAWCPAAAVSGSGDVMVRYVRDASLSSFAIQPRADLAVATPPPALLAPLAGETPIQVPATITNVGWRPSPATLVCLYDGDPAVGGVLLDTQPLPALPVGGSASVNLAWTPSAGSHQLYLVADPTGVVIEFRRDNNTAFLHARVHLPPTLALAPASDTGTPGDLWTADATPTFTGTAAAGMRVGIVIDSASAPLAQTTTSGAGYSLTLPTLTNGWHAIQVQLFDAQGCPSPLSEPMYILIDSTPPSAPATPALAPASDTGVAGDRVTQSLRPQITGAAAAGCTVCVYDGLTLLGQTTAASDGAYTFMPPLDLAPGAHELRATQADALSVVSPASSALSLLLIDPAARALVLNGTNADEAFTLRAQAGNALAYYQSVPATGSPSFLIPAAEFDTVVSRSFGGNDTLTLDGAKAFFARDLHDGTAGLSLILANSAEATFAASQTLSSLALAAGCRAALTAGGSKILRLGALSMPAQARLDLADNDLVLEIGSYFALLDLLRAGQGTGQWNALAGITTSTATPLTGLTALQNNTGQGKPLLTRFGGQDVGLDSLLVKFTYRGDSDLDGQIDGADYQRVDLAFLLGASGQTLRNGDVNYDGCINGDDYFTIDRSFLGQTAVLAAGTSVKERGLFNSDGVIGSPRVEPEMPKPVVGEFIRVFRPVLSSAVRTPLPSATARLFSMRSVSTNAGVLATCPSL